MPGPGCVFEGRGDRPTPSTLVGKRAVAPVECQSYEKHLYIQQTSF